jgi:hypothetical protein
VDRDLLVPLLVIVIAVVAVVLFLFVKKQRTSSLKRRFGDEYDRTVDTIGNQRKAEEELVSREKRVEQFEIHPLTAEQKGRFTESWKIIQGRFVDEPSQAVREADDLVKEVMGSRGYPIADFEQRAADISVHHPTVVGNYRIARDIAAKNRKGQASTEDLRQAVVAYRELFVDLLEEEIPQTKKKHHRVEEEVYHGERNKGAYRN